MQAILDNVWVFIAGILVFLMQAGFAFVEAGLTRAKNVANIMAKNLADVAIGVVAFFAVGYAFAFGGDGTWIGTELFFLGSSEGLFEIGGSGVGNLTIATFFFFQVVFAATAVTIASGAMAERTKFSSYLVFGAVMTAVIYPVVVHWTWGGGLIAQMSIGDAVYSDFAGSTVVHLTGACAALMGALILGPRLGKYAKDGRIAPILGHSMPFTIIGVFILAFGWFGFNAGSELAADTFVMFVGVNTLIAAAAGAIGAVRRDLDHRRQARRRHGRQRCAGRPGLDHRAGRRRRAVGRTGDRGDRWHHRRRRRARFRSDQDRRSGRGDLGPRCLRDMGHALDRLVRQPSTTPSSAGRTPGCSTVAVPISCSCRRSWCSSSWPGSYRPAAWSSWPSRPPSGCESPRRRS